MVMGCRLTAEELAVFGVERIEKNGSRAKYLVPCDVCGIKFISYSYNTSNVYKCRNCKDKHIEIDKRMKKLLKDKVEHEEADEIGIDHEHYQRFESASSKFGLKYYFAIEQASTVMNKFDSIAEAMACIELLYIGVRVIPQQKVGRNRVDFCLPDYKAIIEIDGALYHQDPNKDYWRDVALQKRLGDDWIIKHVPAEAVKQNHALFGKSMKRMLDVRKSELRIVKS